MREFKTHKPLKKTPPKSAVVKPSTIKKAQPKPDKDQEIGGPKGPEPTRYGDWEQGGRCTDF